MRVLAIEDDQELAWFYERALGDAGHEVTIANDGERGLAALADEYDAVLLDLGLPLVDGDEILRVLRALDRRPRIVVVTASGSSCEGVDAVVRKPFAIETLLEALEPRTAPFPLGGAQPETAPGA
jgi:two-component system, OmpR family, response regulator